RLADGVEALTVPAVFWINIVGVWAVIAAALWLSLRVHPGWGLVAAYLLLVNALAHGGQALVLRSPNPGLWTGLALFLPLGAVLWWHLWPQASPLQHLLSIALVALIHAAIFAGVARARKAGHR
ncbi:MAG: HXXEE domain-containing protein, partial [Tabrizicola sp.]